MLTPSTVTKTCFDLLITLLLWTYYLLGFFLFFAPIYLIAFFLTEKREVIFQTLNYLHYRIFFRLLRILAPRVQWHISAEVSAIRSSIIIANHLSFLDPILFISLFRKQKTIVKRDYFRMPVFGRILKASGYIMPLREREHTGHSMDQVKDLSDYLSHGGNLFVFPEGTRSRNGELGPLDKGAFRLARLCQTPIRVVVIRNTGKLFPPERFLFNTQEPCTVEVALAGSLDVAENGEPVPIPDLMQRARNLMERGRT